MESSKKPQRRTSLVELRVSPYASLFDIKTAEKTAYSFIVCLIKIVLKQALTLLHFTKIAVAEYRPSLGVVYRHISYIRAAPSATLQKPRLYLDTKIYVIFLVDERNVSFRSIIQLAFVIPILARCNINGHTVRLDIAQHSTAPLSGYLLLPNKVALHCFA